jgi:hypothetical protein
VIITNEGGDDDDDGGGGGCLVARVFVVLLFATALFLTLVVLCIPTTATSLGVAAAAFAAAAAIAFGLWWLLCGTRCGALLLGWQVFLIGAWVSAFLIGCCPLATAMAVGLAAATTALFLGWIRACHPSACKVTTEVLWVVVSAVGTIFAYLTKLAPCGLPTVPTAAATASVILAVAAAIACGKKP